MKIGVLTSSRADFGIYLPLLKAMQTDVYFDVEIIAFGTHLSSFFGETVKQIEQNGFKVNYRIESMLLTDSAEAVSTAIGLTMIKFADFWTNHNEFDLVFCLGDRYEMFAAVSAGISFCIKFAHLHGGETTLGAIDNVFRDSITLASKYHFVSTVSHAKRAEEILGHTTNVYNVGALSLDNLKGINLLSISEFKAKWNVDLSKKTILVTFHPETMAVEKNNYYVKQLVGVLKALDKFQVLITMPNADTTGNMIRTEFIENFAESKNVSLIENLGSQSYFTAMKYCSFLLGNTSSGIIEAASFGKYVINLGDRQKGRAYGKNVIHTPINSEQILLAVSKVLSNGNYDGINIYHKDNVANLIVKILKQIPVYEN